MSINPSIAVVIGEIDEQTMEDMNKMAKEYYDSVWHNIMDDCTNKNALQIVSDWWSSKKIFNKEYESNYSKEDLIEAHDRILEIVSLGCG